MPSKLSPENLAPNATADETENAYQRLLAFLDLASGSAFAIARCNLPSLRKEILQRAASDAKTMGIVVKEVDISAKYSGDFAAAVKAGLDGTPAAGRLAVMVTGIDGLIYHSASQENLGGEGRTPFIARLNFNREDIAHELPFPVVLWLESESLTLLLKQAPDFTQWISGHFQFGGPGAEAKALDHLMESDKSLPSQPAAETREQLQEFSGLLQELNETRGREDAHSLRRRIAVLYALADRYFRLSDYTRARQRFTDALEVARKLKDRRGEGIALGGLGHICNVQGDSRHAVEYYEQALGIAREIGDRRGEGNALGNLGAALRRLGNIRRAITCQEQALAIHRELGDRKGEAHDLGNLGVAQGELGDCRLGIQYLEQALTVAHEMGDRLDEAIGLRNLGNAYYKLGDSRRALEYHERALAIAREIGDRQGEAVALGNLGTAYSALGEVRRAIEYFEQGLVIARGVGDERSEGIGLINLALSFERLGNRRLAVTNGEAALKILEEIEDPNAAKVRKQVAEWRKG
jgi:tetratricopeptide (TPR) repeat protein